MKVKFTGHDDWILEVGGKENNNKDNKDGERGVDYFWLYQFWDNHIFSI